MTESRNDLFEKAETEILYPEGELPSEEELAAISARAPELKEEEDAETDRSEDSSDPTGDTDT